MMPNIFGPYTVGIGIAHHGQAARIELTSRLWTWARAFAFGHARCQLDPGRGSAGCASRKRDRSVAATEGAAEGALEGSSFAYDA